MTVQTPPRPATPTRPAPAPLRLGRFRIDTPVVLAPMAGVTNAPFRQLCREYGAGVYVSEMVTSRALVERTPESMRLVSHDPGEAIRSVQLYGVDPVTVGAAVRMIVEEDLADHVDLNFGCPVPKVTRRGGGSALPWKTELFRSIVTAAVREAEPAGVPVTVKMRTGIDADHLTYLEAGRIARDAGVAWVALHGRTAAEFYSGHADWSAIARLREALPDLPVLGNGDIFSAEDALRMMATTGVDGVVVGRGCQGRPWLFADLAAALSGSDERVRPGLRKVAETFRRHATLLVEHYGDELKALRDMRKHVAWYFKGYPVGGDVRARLARVSSLAELDDLLGLLDLDMPYPGAGVEGPRGRAGKPRRPTLPEGWLDSRVLEGESARMIHEAELSVSGG